MSPKTFSNQQDIRLFFLLAFVWTWLLHLPRLLAAAGWLSLPGGISSGLGIVAAFGPALAAFVLTGFRFGNDGLRILWRRGWEIPCRKVWLLPALLLMPLSSLVTLGWLTAVGVSLPWEYALPPAMLVPVGLLIWLGGALPEEFGWRGFALDRLQAHLGPLPASLALGLIWSLWHLPLHFIPGTTQSILPIGEFTIQTLVLAILYTWLHNRTGGSVLIAGLFHATGNLTGALIPSWVLPLGRWMGLLPLLITAVIVVLAGGLRQQDH